MKRIKTLLLLLIVAVCFSFSGCIFFTWNWNPDPSPADVVYSINKSENRVEIVIEALNNDEMSYTLMNVMQLAKDCGEWTYEVSGGLVTSIEGKENAADFSSCWMLFTSDAEMANTEWGTITLGEQTLGSAILGAEALTVLEGATYVWSYESF